MHPLLHAGIRAGGRLLWNWLTESGGGAVEVEWSRSMQVALPVHHAKRAVATFLERRDCRLEKDTGQVALYFRGDRSIKSLPAARDVDWLEVPMLVGAAFGEADGWTIVHIGFKSLPGVRFSPAAKEFFHEHAEAEYDAVFDLLKELAEDFR